MIIISPFSRPMRNGQTNPKNYPYFIQLVNKLKENGHFVCQIGAKGEQNIIGCDEYHFGLSLEELEKLTLSWDTFISVDNFYPHFCNLLKKSGIVIFGQSDPEIFGYKIHTNILKDKKYLRKLQFDIWEKATYNKEAFDTADVLFNKIKKVL
jgi:ADP-heptose:LPS heptosyltransferase